MTEISKKAQVKGFHLPDGAWGGAKGMGTEPDTKYPDKGSKAKKKK